MLAEKIRELYLQTPETNRELREFLFWWWVAAPSQSEHVMAIAAATDDPALLRSLGGILVFNEDNEGLPGGIALLGRRLQDSPRHELTEAILNALEKSPSEEAGALLRDWASAHPEETQLRHQIINSLHGGAPEDAKYLTTLITSSQEQKDIQIAAVKSLSKNMLSEEPLLQRFLSVGLDPNRSDEIRLQSARTLTHAMAGPSEPKAPLLALAKGTMETTVSNDPSREVRDAARRAALEVWRKERLERELAEDMEQLQKPRTEEEMTQAEERAKQKYEEIDRISQALQERRRNKEITREEAHAEFERQTAHLRDPAEATSEEQKKREEEAYMKRLDDLHPETATSDGKSWRDLDEE